MTFADFLRDGEPLGLKLTDAGHAALGRDPVPLEQRCAWCNVVIRPGRLTLDGKCSHGICPQCAVEHFGPFDNDGDHFDDVSPEADAVREKLKASR